MGKFASVFEFGLAVVGTATVAAGVTLALSLRQLRQGDPPKSFSLLSTDGLTLMEVTKVEFREDDLALKGKMMGTMPTTAVMTPEEAAKAIRLIPAELLKGVPRFLAAVHGLKWPLLPPAQTQP